MEQLDVRALLDAIDPAGLNYQEWVSVGMGLKEAGCTAADWDAWSARDRARYHPGECARKWESFQGQTGSPVTAGTIVHLARQNGWTPPRAPGHVLDWDDEIADAALVDPNWIEGREVAEPAQWDPAAQLIRYLETLFDSSDMVGYVTESWEKDGRYVPARGVSDRTAGELIQALSACGGDLGRVLGDYNPAVGAWIRFNPLDGKGVRNDNVTEYRYALVESDSMPVEEQHAVIRALELPVACLVHSGGRSLHAIVRIEAASYEEYRARVDYLYQVCEQNGLSIDRQNRNPSRLSRMPGVLRGGRKQYIVGTDLGKPGWTAWRDWIESVTDDLPEIETLAGVWDNLPALAPPLIAGMLRQGHKMLLAGPSKAAKSFGLIELAIAIAEGQPWMGRFPCAQGRVLYVNLELDRPSCLHRIRDVYDALGLPPRCIGNLHVWNLRGSAVPMDKLAPKLIRRARRMDYIAVIIDPIYKVITGDENSADQMAQFCNQFDKVCKELGCAVIYCHHHSKGAQGGKRSMDRASGSGVFARDPDAMLDMIGLPVSEALRKQVTDKAVARVCLAALRRADRDYLASLDDRESAAAMRRLCAEQLPEDDWAPAAEAARQAANAVSAWRIEATLREFATFPPVNVWFDYPIHKVDDSGVLGDVQPDAETPPWKRAMDCRKPKERRVKERSEALEMAFAACSIEDVITVENLASYMGTSEKTVRRRLKEHGGFTVSGSVVTRTET